MFRGHGQRLPPGHARLQTGMADGRLRVSRIREIALFIPFPAFWGWFARGALL